MSSRPGKYQPSRRHPFEEIIVHMPERPRVPVKTTTRGLHMRVASQIAKRLAATGFKCILSYQDDRNWLVVVSQKTGQPMGSIGVKIGGLATPQILQRGASTALIHAAIRASVDACRRQDFGLEPLDDLARDQEWRETDPLLQLNPPKDACRPSDSTARTAVPTGPGTPDSGATASSASTPTTPHA